MYNRLSCVLSCINQIIFDAYSAFQVGNYIDQVIGPQAAPSRIYSLYYLQLFYWRDIISLGMHTPPLSPWSLSLSLYLCISLYLFL